MNVEVCPRLYRHGKVSMQFNSKGGFSVKVNGVEVAGSPNTPAYVDTLKSLAEDDNFDGNTRQGFNKIHDAATRSLYAEYVMVEP